MQPATQENTSYANLVMYIVNLPVSLGPVLLLDINVTNEIIPSSYYQDLICPTVALNMPEEIAQKAVNTII